MIKAEKILLFSFLFILSYPVFSFRLPQTFGNRSPWMIENRFGMKRTLQRNCNDSSRWQRPLSSPIVLRAALLPQSNSFFLTRIVFLRALAFVHFVAFLVAKHQNKALIGDTGITPARHILDVAQARGSEKRLRRDEWLNSTLAKRPRLYETINNHNILAILANTKFVRSLRMAINHNTFYQHWRERLWDRADGMGRPVTTLLWLAKDRRRLNPWLDGIAICGMALSLIVFWFGAANVPLILGMWLCQRSLMAVGGPWYGYGWEPQLAELGFHSLFLVPLWSLNPISSMPPLLVLFAIRWHLWRVMMGAGLIKLKSGDPKWKLQSLSAMNYFYETQPVPNPLTRYMHWAPIWWHKVEVLVNHFVELVAPWLLLVPVPSWRRAGAWIQIIFQITLISTGNLSFLNWLTMVPALACLDDAYLAKWFPSLWVHKASVAALSARPSVSRQVITCLFSTLVAFLSIPVVKNLLSKRQLMNASFDPLRLINTYGAFGTVDEERLEYIISAASDVDGPWKEYQFKVKRGDIWRKPRFLSPYHYRLDWQMWIASTVGSLERSPWMYNFLLKLLEQDLGVLRLLDSNPFEGETKGPKYIRVEKYVYKFRKPDCNSTSPQPYWDRKLIGRVFPRQGVADRDTLLQYTSLSPYS